MARVGEKEVKNPQECDLRRLRTLDYLEAPKKENKEILIAPQLTVMKNNYMNQKDYCYCGQDLPCPRHGCGVDHQPKPEAPDCGVKFGVFTCPFKKPCKEHPSPASTEVKCGCVPLHKEMQNGVEVYSQTTCFRHSKEYREPIEDVEQPTPASTEDWELRSGFRCAKMCVCKQNNADGVNKKEV